MIEAILHIFAFMLIFSCCAVVFVQNPVHCVLFLVSAFFNAAAILIIIGAEYIAMTLVIVYVGAVAVLFLFVVMMLDIRVKKSGSMQLYRSIGLIIAAIACLQLCVAVFQSSSMLPLPEPKHVESHGNAHALGMLLYTDYLLPFQISGLLLLVAMIGAITLTMRESKQAKKQNVYDQMMRSKENCIKLVDVQPREGVKNYDGLFN